MTSYVQPALLLRTATRRPQFSVCSACARRLTNPNSNSNISSSSSRGNSKRWSSTETAPPALLSKIKGDLKSAMKAKDTARLNVLRSIITETNNAAKTTSPVRTDLQVLAMLRKRKASSEAAQKEAADNKRDDIAAKQQSEIDVIDEYAGSVQMMTEDDIKGAIGQLVEQMKSAAENTKAGQVLKEVFKPGGLLDGKPVDRAQVTKIVGDLLGGKKS